MIHYSCDVCGYLIRGSVCFLYGKHFCSSECVQTYEKGEKYENKPAHQNNSAPKSGQETAFTQNVLVHSH